MKTEQEIRERIAILKTEVFEHINILEDQLEDKEYDDATQTAAAITVGVSLIAAAAIILE